MQKILIYTCFLIFPLLCFATDPHFQTTEEILALAHQQKPTECASKIFSDALRAHANEVSETDDERIVRAWAKQTMESPDVLKQILNECPEMAVDDTETIHFTPIVYKFSDAPDARTLTINYSVQPRVLKQKLILASKPSLPNGDANPKLMDPDDPAKYLNTEPAWYAIMVVQHDSLKDFVGNEKNNTLSVKYLDDHIDAIYPKGYYCTSKSAISLGNNADTINKVVHKVVDIEDDTNDYYVAGDVNLEWVMYAEISAEVLITVATLGIGEGAMIGLKSIRAGKTGVRLAKNLSKLKKIDKVKDYVEATNRIAKNTDKISKMEQNVANAKKYENALKNAEKAKQAGKDASKYEKEAQEILEKAKKIDSDITSDALKNTDNFKDSIKTLEKETKDLNETLEKTLKENKKLLDDKKKALKKARKDADRLSVKYYDKTAKELDSTRDLIKSEKELNKIKDADKRAKAIEKNNQLKQRAQELEKTLKDIEGGSTLGDYGKLKREINELESIDKYVDTAKQLDEVIKYRKDLLTAKHLFTRPQTGNIFTKNLKRIKAIGKTLRASNTGAKTMGKAGRVARAGMSSRSAKFGDWLFDVTLKHGARLGRIYRDTGIVYGVLTFLGDMYDRTSATSKEFSNGIEFKPLCLLSADDLAGQENVVNYGMWLMWVGNSTDPADDDAAYLQAMDFAAKFYYQLDEYQDEHGANCNVDIYVVRPIIRLDETNTDDPHGELFYLFMNEIPWSTAEQFGEQIKDVEDWERNQQQLEETDPDGKYAQPEQIADSEEYDEDYEDEE